VQRVIDDARAAGFTGSDSDIIIAGHSLGGAGARHLVDVNDKYGAFALVGTAYVSKSNVGELVPGYPADIASWKTPFLAVSGEVDMLSVTHMTQLLKQYDDLTAEEKKVKVPVIIPGMDHSQWCPGFNVSGDNVADISNEEAVDLAGSVVGSWINSIYAPTPAAESLLTKFVESFTRPILGAFIEATSNEPANYCAHAQLIKASLPLEYAQRIKPVVTTPDSLSNLEHFHPNATFDADNNLIVTVGSLPFYDNDSKISPSQFISSYVGAQDLSCKMLSGSAIGQKFGLPIHKDAKTGKEVPALSCGDVNKFFIQEGERLLNKYWPQTMKRFVARGGKKILTMPDEQTSIGPQFIFISAVNFDTKSNKDAAQVTSPALYSTVDSHFYPGSDYCKFLSPAKVIEWYMTYALTERYP